MSDTGKEDKEKEVEDPEVAALEKKTALLTAKKDLLEAQKALVTTTLPTVESKAAEGSAESTDGDSGKLAELAAYAAMKDCVTEIVNQVSSSVTGYRILIVDKLGFALLDQPDITVRVGLNHYQKRFEDSSKRLGQVLQQPQLEAVTEMVSGALVVAPYVLSYLSNIADFFRTSYTVKGAEIKLSDDSLRMNAAGLIKEKCEPKEIRILNFWLIKNSQVYNKLESALTAFDEADDKRAEVSAMVERLKKDSENEAAGSATNDNGESETNTQLNQTPVVKQAAQNPLLKQAETALDYFQNVSAAFDKFLNSITTTADGQQAPPLVAAAAKEQIEKVDRLLYLTVVSNQGHAISRKQGFLAWLKDSTPKIDYVGGCAVSYVLAEATGNVINSKTVIRLAKLPYEMTKDNLSFVPLTKDDAANEAAKTTTNLFYQAQADAKAIAKLRSEYSGAAETIGQLRGQADNDAESIKKSRDQADEHAKGIKQLYETAQRHADEIEGAERE